MLSTMLEYLVVLQNGGSGDPGLSVFPRMHMLVRHLPIRPAEKPDQIGSEHDEEESWQPVKALAKSRDALFPFLSQAGEKKGIHSADDAKADIESETPETEHGGATTGIDLGIEIVRGKEIQEAHSESEKYRDQDSPDWKRKRQTDQPDNGHNRND